MHTGKSATQTALVAVLVFLIALSLAPFAMMLIMSLKSNAQIFGNFWNLPDPARWDFYPQAVMALKGYIANTLIVALATVSGVLVLSSMAAYTFARHEFPGKTMLYFLILGLLMIPGVLTLIPSYALVRSLRIPEMNVLGFKIGPFGIINTWWALILPYVAGGQVMGIFLCRGFFQGIPEALFEAARIDGAREHQLYFRIALPLSRPILATIAIMTVLGVYNDYLWPLIVISDASLQTFSVGVTRFGGEYHLDYGPTLAGYVVGSIPLIVLFLFGMRQFVTGITAGGVKA